MCACGSIPPGITILPRASMTRPASAARVPGQPTATIFSPWIPTSISPTAWGVTTCPPLITRSSMAHLLAAFRILRSVEEQADAVSRTLAQEGYVQKELRDED